MQLWEGVAWGAFGGFAMEALDFIIAVRRWHRLPWCVGASTLTPNRAAVPTRRGHQPPQELAVPGLLAYSIAGTLRIMVGGGLSATVVSTSPHTASAWIAVLTGATAPLLLEKLTTMVPLLVHGDKGILLPQVEDNTARNGPQAGGSLSSSESAVGPATATSEGE
ncbi:hypothetical protein [Streptomyces sp. NBC_00568]|uniref:hypothetical protein n=1 Tax=Streptomyces sp. NBC_00568 TaxID=2975779 RepID=UPI00225B8CA3|nr:hypothetical protein [Streptomyces sp. NBC_00568]MCX4993390.1 hypothetical protein [Streptomyces sp. NBC_00568]